MEISLSFSFLVFNDLIVHIFKYFGFKTRFQVSGVRIERSETSVDQNLNTDT